jgi:pimeloyl-ACP methyl ester carboxylesterase
MTGMLEGTVDPNSLPAWLTEKEFDYFVGEFERTGFRGAFNWYRAYDQTWEATAPFAGATIQQPALYIAGAEDPAMDIPGFTEALARMPALLPGLESPVIIPDAGHWVQLERADEVNTALIAFLRTLKG